MHEAGSELGHEAKLLNTLLALIAQLWAQASMPFQIPTCCNVMATRRESQVQGWTKTQRKGVPDENECKAS